MDESAVAETQEEIISAEGLHVVAIRFMATRCRKLILKEERVKLLVIYCFMRFCLLHFSALNVSPCVIFLLKKHVQCRYFETVKSLKRFDDCYPSESFLFWELRMIFEESFEPPKFLNLIEIVKILFYQVLYLKELFFYIFCKFCDDFRKKR